MRRAIKTIFKKGVKDPVIKLKTRAGFILVKYSELRSLLKQLRKMKNLTILIRMNTTSMVYS